MADTNLVKFGAQEESSWGVTPASARQNMNVTSVALQRARTRNAAPTLRGDRRNSAPNILQENGTLTVNAPLQIGNLLLFMEGALGTDEAADYAISGTGISFTSPSTIADSGNGFGGLAVGDFVYVTGAGAGTNANKWFGPITAAAAGSLTVPSGVATQAAGSTVNLNGRKSKDGTTAKSYSVEEDLSSALASNFRSGAGFRVGSWGLSWSVSDYAQETFALTGKIPTFANATIFTGSATAAPTSDFLNSLEDFSNLYIDNAANALCMASISFSLDAGADPFYCVGGTAGPSGIGQNKIVPTFEISAYYDAVARALLDDADANTTRSIKWEMEDDQGNQLLIYMPSVKLDGDDNVSGPDARIMATIRGTAFENTTYGYQIAVFRKTA